MRPGWPLPACRSRCGSPRRSPWRGGCWPAPTPPVSRRRGARRTSSTAATAPCAVTCRPAASGMSWLWPEITASPPARPSGRNASTRSPPHCRRERGTVTAPVMAPRERGCTTGPGWPSPHPRTRRSDITLCWSVATCRTANWCSTAAGHPHRSACPLWSGWPAPAGVSRPASRPRKARSASTSTRSAGGTPGTATPLWS